MKLLQINAKLKEIIKLFLTDTQNISVTHQKTQTQNHRSQTGVRQNSHFI